MERGTDGHKQAASDAFGAVPHRELLNERSGSSTVGDVLRGADAVAAFLFGETGQRRSVYRLAAQNKLPLFRIGRSLCARRSVLITWMAAQEKSPSKGPRSPQEFSSDDVGDRFSSEKSVPSRM